MNIFLEGIEGQFAVSADDADMLIRMVEEAHRPFIVRPYVGDIASEWRRRWQQGQPGPQRESVVAARYSMNVEAATQALRETYSGTGKRIEAPGGQEFPLEAAIRAILLRWPGIELGRPENDWNSRKEIAELRMMRTSLQSLREMPESESLRSGGRLATTWS